VEPAAANLFFLKNAGFSRLIIRTFNDDKVRVCVLHFLRLVEDKPFGRVEKKGTTEQASGPQARCQHSVTNPRHTRSQKTNKCYANDVFRSFWWPLVYVFALNAALGRKTSHPKLQARKSLNTTRKAGTKGPHTHQLDLLLTFCAFSGLDRDQIGRNQAKSLAEQFTSHPICLWLVLASISFREQRPAVVQTP